MALRNLVALFVLCAGCAGGSEQSPAVDEVAPVASVQAPTRLPRSLWEIKKKDTEVAWDHQAALSLATAARSEGHQIAGLFHPDQQGFGTIERLKPGCSASALSRRQYLCFQSDLGYISNLAPTPTPEMRCTPVPSSGGVWMKPHGKGSGKRSARRVGGTFPGQFHHQPKSRV